MLMARVMGRLHSAMHMVRWVERTTRLDMLVSMRISLMITRKILEKPDQNILILMTMYLMEEGQEQVRRQLRTKFSRSTRATKATDIIEIEEIKRIRRNRNTITLMTRKLATKEEGGKSKCFEILTRRKKLVAKPRNRRSKARNEQAHFYNDN